MCFPCISPVSPKFISTLGIPNFLWQGAPQLQHPLHETVHSGIYVCCLIPFTSTARDSKGLLIWSPCWSVTGIWIWIIIKGIWSCLNLKHILCCQSYHKTGRKIHLYKSEISHKNEMTRPYWNTMFSVLHFWKPFPFALLQGKTKVQNLYSHVSETVQHTRQLKGNYLTREILIKWKYCCIKTGCYSNQRNRQAGKKRNILDFSH